MLFTIGVPVSRVSEYDADIRECLIYVGQRGV